MIKTLRSVVVPKLKELGFKGSFPHFRRTTSEKIDLLVFQFNKYGGSFWVEIASCPLEGKMTYLGTRISPQEITVYDLSSKERIRLSPKMDENTDHPWKYNMDNPIAIEYQKVAEQVLPFIRNQAEQWWKQNTV
jgi:hypothetical protein